jgi:uncharacterized protein (DUF433 family)
MDLPDFLTRGTYGEIRVTGSRIDLMHVVDASNDGLSAEQIHDEFDSVPLDLVRRVLAFYEANRAEVDAYVAECHAEMDRCYANYTPSPAILRSRQLYETVERADAEHVGDPEWARLSIFEKLRRLGLMDLPEPR